MPPVRIISTVQFRPRLATCPADVGDNFRRIDPLLCQVMETGSQFVVFPELFLTGYSFLKWEEAARVAEIFDGSTFKAMRAFAIRAKAYVTWGYPEADGTGRLYNSCTMVSPDGEIVTKYRKINLWGNDYFWATSGEEAAPIVQTEFGLTSVIICRDLRDKIPSNIPRLAAESGKRHYEGRRVDIVAASTDWGKGGFPSTTWIDFATNNRCVLVVANRWGDEHGSYSFVQDFGQGGIAVIEPGKKVHINGIQFSSDCVVTAVLT
jgi:predicted amidohydrolase